MLVINSINNGIGSSFAQFCSLIPDVTIGSLGMRPIIILATKLYSRAKNIFNLYIVLTKMPRC